MADDWKTLRQEYRQILENTLEVLKRAEARNRDMQRKLALLEQSLTQNRR